MRSKLQSSLRSTFSSLFRGPLDDRLKQRRKAHHSRNRRPVIESLEDRTMLVNDLDAMTSALNSRLNAAKNGLASVVNAATATLPILNRSLSSIKEITQGKPDNPIIPGDQSVPGFVDQIRSTIVKTFNPLTNAQLTQTEIQTRLFNALTTAGILGDTNGSGGANPITREDVYVSPIGKNAAGKIINITIEVCLTGKMTVASEAFKFGLGLPAVPFRIESLGGLTVTTGFDYRNLKFGLEGGKSFFDTTALNEFGVDVTAKVNPGSTLTGIVGFLDVTATPNSLGPTQLDARLVFDVKNTDKFASDVRLVDPRLEGGANVNLTLTATMESLAGGLSGQPADKIRFLMPRLETDLKMQWPFNGSNPSNAATALGAVPSVAFNDVRVSLGQFMSSMLGPTIRDLKTLLGPQIDAFAILNRRIPGISDLSEAAKLGPLTPLGLANAIAANAQLPPDIAAIIEAANTASGVLDLIDKVSAATGNDVKINFGSFNLADSNGDLRRTSLKQLPDNLRGALKNLNDGRLNPNQKEQLTQLASSFANDARTLLDRVKADNNIPQIVKDKLEDLNRYLDTLNNKVKLEFPLFNNPSAGVFKLLLGQDADLVKFTFEFHSPPFNAFEKSYPLYKLAGIDIEAVARGEIDFDINIVAGYDTYGLRQLFKKGFEGLSEGFYVDSNKDLLNVRGSIGLGAAASLPLYFFVSPIGGALIGVKISAEVIGSVRLNDFHIRFEDPNGDGRFRIFTEPFRQPNKPFVNTGGTLSVDLKFNFVVHTPIPLLEDVVLYTKELAAQTLLDLSLPQFQVNPFLPAPGEPPGQVPVAIDLNSLPTANDGVPDEWILRVTNDGNYQLFKHGLFFVPGSGFMSYETPIGDPKPINQVSEVLVWGSSDDDYFTIEGSLRKPISIDGRGGHNGIIFNEAPVNFRPAYTFYETRGGAYPQRLKREYGNGLEIVDIRHSGMESVTVNAVQDVGGSFLVRGVPAGTKLILQGGSENFWSLGAEVFHMNGFFGDLQIHGGSSGQDYVTMNDVNNVNPDLLNARTSFLVKEDHVQRIHTSQTTGGANNIDIVKTVDIVDIELTGIDRVDIVGSHAMPTKYVVQSNSLNRLFIIGGGAADSFIVGNSVSALDYFYPRSHTNIFGQDIPQRLSFHGGGGKDSLVFNDLAAQTNPETVSIDYLVSASPPVAEINEPTTKFRRNVTEHNREMDGSIIINENIDEFLFSGIDDVHVYGAAFNGANYAIDGFGGNRSTDQLTIHSNVYADTVQVGDYSTGFGPIGAKVLLDERGGADQLILINSAITLAGDPVTNAPLATAGRLTNFPLSFSGFENLRLRSLIGIDSRATLLANPIGTSTLVSSFRTVNVGGGNLANIRGSVKISTFVLDVLAPPTDLTVDDSADSTPRNLEIGANSVRGPSENDILFGSAVLSSLTVNGGPAGNNVILHNTRTSIPYVLNTGLGADLVQIEQTSSVVAVNGQGGADTVNIGLNGNMQGITAQLTVTNLGNWSTLNLDDSANTSPRTVTVGIAGIYGTVIGLAPTLVRYRKTDLRALNVWGGNGNDTFDVRSTVQSTFPGGSPTTLYAGGGLDFINVVGTVGPLFIDPQGNSNQITIGGRPGESGSLGGIRGDVTLRGQEGVRGNFVDIIDRSNGERSVYTMDADRFYRTIPSLAAVSASIFYGELPMDGLDILGGNGVDEYLIHGSPAGEPTVVGGGVNVLAGNRTDSVTVLGTGGQLSVDLGNNITNPGENVIQSIRIGDSTHSLDAVKGAVNVSGKATSSGDIVATVSNEASTQSQVTTIRAVPGTTGAYETLERTRFVTDHYEQLNFFSFKFTGPAQLHYTAGQASDITFLLGSPANFTNYLIGGASPDYFSISADQSPLLGPVHVSGGAANNDNLLYYDSNSTSAQTWNFVGSNSVNSMNIERTGAAHVRATGMGQIVFATATVGGNTVNVRGLPANIFLNTVASRNDVFTLVMGSDAPGQGNADLLGTISVAGNDHVSVIVDDSGNLTPRQVTVNSKQDVYGDFVTGLVERKLYTRLDGTSSLTILGGQGSDRFAVNGVTFGPAVRIHGGGGVNSLDYTGTANIDGLVSWYQGESNFQDSFGGNHGDIYSTARSAPGKVGQAFSFDASQDQYVRIDNTAALQPTTVSVEAWVNSTQVGRNAYLLAKGASQNTAASYALTTGNQSGLAFYVSDGTNQVESPNAGDQVWDGQWHHVVGTFDGTTVRLYVDGTQIGEGTTTNIKIAYNLPTSNDLIIGNYFGTSRHPFNGRIDEAAVFNRALTVQDVQKHFATGGRGLTGAAEGVRVNLPLGTATGLRGGIANIQNVVGSAYQDILVGNGSNVLNGGLGRDLLIAGRLPGILEGGADEDILVGGRLNDSSPANLDAIMAEWASATSYTSRVANLRAGLLANNKITGNGGGNTLIGGSDALDLFFGSLVMDLQQGEELVPL